MLLPTLLKATLGSLFALGCCTLAGCGDKPAPEPDNKQPAHDDHSHDEHAHGPHEGAIVELPGERHAEWVVDEKTDTVTVYILDEELKNEVPIAAEKVTISVSTGGQTKTYDLLAVGGGAEASQFKLEKAPVELIGSLEGGEMTELLLLVPLDGQEVSAKLEPHHH